MVNLPVMIFAPEGWRKFYTFSQERPIDFGSFWLIITQRTGKPIDVETVNTASVVLMVVFCAGIAGLALSAARRPRFAQLAFLVVAAFILTNKVYSPQYVLWLIPLAVLARPRWRDFLIWQACEVSVLPRNLVLPRLHQRRGQAPGTAAGGLPGRDRPAPAGHAVPCALVVRDILVPAKDPVRADGADDPSGGVLDGAPDTFVLAPEARTSGHAARTDGPQVEWCATPTRNG